MHGLRMVLEQLAVYVGYAFLGIFVEFDSIEERLGGSGGGRDGEARAGAAVGLAGR